MRERLLRRKNRTDFKRRPAEILDDRGDELTIDGKDGVFKKSSDCFHNTGDIQDSVFGA
jgi:hypothetical protein